MNKKSSPIAWGLIMALLLAVTLFTSAGIGLAQPDLCSGYARQYADRYANPGGNTPGNAFGGAAPCAPSGVIACTPCSGASSNSNWSFLYDHAYNSCAREVIVH
jgi:hypothetical protein